MFQILDIGNTHTRIAFWDNGEFISIKVVDTAALDCCEFSSIPAAAACVCAEVRKKLDGCGINFISALNQRSEVDFSLVDCSTLGADRVANAAALAEFYPLPFRRTLPSVRSAYSPASPCLTISVVTESQPCVHRLRLSASP